MKIKKGDLVKIRVGKDRGKTGKVEKVFPKKNKLKVEGINIVKKHVKPRGKGEQGGIIKVNNPLPVANVSLVCPECKKPARVGYKINSKGVKNRICKKCGKNV